MKTTYIISRDGYTPSHKQFIEARDAYSKRVNQGTYPKVEALQMTFSPDGDKMKVDLFGEDESLDSAFHGSLYLADSAKRTRYHVVCPDGTPDKVIKTAKNFYKEGVDIGKYPHVKDLQLKFSWSYAAISVEFKDISTNKFTDIVYFSPIP